MTLALQRAATASCGCVLAGSKTRSCHDSRFDGSDFRPCAAVAQDRLFGVHSRASPGLLVLLWTDQLSLLLRCGADPRARRDLDRKPALDFNVRGRHRPAPVDLGP